MKFTHAQILELTGMSPDRLRHWRREIPGLDDRAGRNGVVTFEEIALLAVLNLAMDELGISVGLIAAHYNDLLSAFSENEHVGLHDTVLWLAVDAASVGPATSPPTAETAAMVRITPVVQRLMDALSSPSRGQLPLQLGDHRSG
jgi:hypothetical protein